MAENIVLNQATIMDYLKSEVEFPVDFEYAWKWLGYSSKSNALQALKRDFIKGVEFSCSITKKPGRGRSSDSYFLTNTCFKEMAMMAGTDKGKEVRRYYIECEKSLKQRQYKLPSPPALTAEQSIGILSEAFRIFKLEDSPRHLQLAQDRIANLLAGSDSALAIAPPKWFGVVEIAEQLGFKPYDVLKHRSTLGRMIAAWYRDRSCCEPKTEERLVNGRMCELKVYQRSDELDSMIASYLENKGIQSA